MDNSFFSSKIQSMMMELIMGMMNRTAKADDTPKLVWVKPGRVESAGSAAETALDGAYQANAGSGKGKAAQFDEIIQAAAEKYDVDPDLVRSVIKAESNYNPRAVSSAGAQGLMQLMPGTAKGLGVKDSLDPVENIMGGTKLLHRLLTKYDGNVRLALAAYNAGPGAVDRYGGIPPYRETQTYVSRVMGYYESERTWNA